MAIRINSGRVPPAVPQPNAGRIPEVKNWVFSLQHWRQINHFGVGQCEKKWFISLIERLSELSRLSIEEFLGSRQQQSAIRFHEIDWDATAIPIKKEDIDWIGPISSSEDFAFVQFHVSKALGRVVGYFDERQIFQIVLLDPQHNIQPSGVYDYRVRTTYLGQCQLTTLIGRFELAITHNTKLSEAEKVEMLAGLVADYKDLTDGAFVFAVDQAVIDRAHKIMAQGVANRLGDLIGVALDSLE